MISTVSPVSLAGDTATVTVNGSGFLPASVAKLNGTIVSTTFNSSAKLIATGSLRAATAQLFPTAIPLTAFSLIVTNPDSQIWNAASRSSPAPRPRSSERTPKSVRATTSTDSDGAYDANSE